MWVVLKMIGVVLLIVAALGMIGQWSERRSWPAENRRKAVHIVLGLVTLSFPWLFDRPLWVWILGGVSLGLMLALRSRRFHAFGNVIHGVRRHSYGDLCYPLVAALTFQFAAGNALFFVVPMLVLALADAAGALVGVHYGQRSFATEEGAKTVEGSLAVGLVAFPCVYLPLWLATDIGHPESVLIALLVAFMVVGVEAISLWGMDNLYLPLVVLGLMVDLQQASLVMLMQRAAVLTLVVVGGVVLQQRARLSATALLAAMLVHFMTWALAGPQWLWPMLLTAVVYTFLCARGLGAARPRHGLFGVVSVAAAPLFWLITATALEWNAGWGAFATALAIQSGLMVALSLEGRAHPWSGWQSAVAAGVVAGLQLVLVLWMGGASVVGIGAGSAGALLFALGGALTAVLLTRLFGAFEQERGGPNLDPLRWWLQGGIGFVGSTVGLFF